MGDYPGVDLLRDHQHERRLHLLQRPLDRRGVEKPDRDIDGFAVKALTIDMNFACMYHRAQPYLQRRVSDVRVVFDQKRRQLGYQVTEQDSLGHIIMWPDQE